jgi:hypothetical protein
MRPVAISLIMILITSCAPSLRYYTKDLQDDSRWTDSALKKIQFYVSGDIFLWRDVTRGESVISNGKIKIIDGREVEEVVIKKGTPGIFLFSPKSNHYAISFDAKDKSAFLVFGPSEKVNNRYVLLAKEWATNYGKVTYGDKMYHTGAESAYVYLMVNVDRSGRTTVSRSAAGGRKVE